MSKRGKMVTCLVLALVMVSVRRGVHLGVRCVRRDASSCHYSDFHRYKSEILCHIDSSGISVFGGNSISGTWNWVVQLYNDF